MPEMNSKSRTYNSIKNISYGFLATAASTLVSFVTRTVFIKTLGIDYLGIDGLLTEVISMLSLAELGIGTAIVYNLYEPLHNRNQERICQLLGLYKTAYRLVAFITFLAGMALMPVIDKLVTQVDFSDGYIRCIFLLFVIRTSSSYLFSYKASLLNADQKQYAVVFIQMAVKFAAAIFCVTVLLLSENYILYLLILIIQNLCANIMISKYTDRQYPYLVSGSKMKKEDRNAVFDNIKNIFIKKVSGVITNSTDNILISRMVSTIQVGFYNNYAMIFMPVRMLKTQLAAGITAGIGDLCADKDGVYSERVLRNLTYIFFFISSAVSVLLLGMTDLFIMVWLGQGFVMDKAAVYIAVLNIFMEMCFEPLWQFMEVSGLFDKDRNIGIAGSCLNLAVSAALGWQYGMAGIFMGTIASRTVQMILKAKVLYRNRFEKKEAGYLRMVFKMAAVFILMTVPVCLSAGAASNVSLASAFIIRLSAAVSAALAGCIIPFYKSTEFIFFKEFLCKFTDRHKRSGRKE
ncbi:MAG: hypothetical protein HFH32_16730 [Eubacterium sp.]|nr:hypothetical protein [Eubacterium sp.]